MKHFVSYVRFPAGATDLSLLQSVKTGSEAQPVFYSIRTAGLGDAFTEAKVAGA
jgi:hypothetical protein